MLRNFRIIICLIITLIFANSISQTKVYFALISPYDSEPEVFKCFIAGYESAGGKWNGIIGSDTSVRNTGAVNNVMPYCQANGFNLVLRNSGVDDNFIQGTDPFYFNGIQVVACSGDNRFRFNTGHKELNHIVLCGAGDNQNQTSYSCEFFDTHPFAEINIIKLEHSSDTVLVTTDGAFILQPGEIANFSNMKGFDNNITGEKNIVQYVTDSYNQFKVLHKLGNGSFKPGGKIKIYYQSYSHAFIAGKLAYIKDHLNCSWWEARYRMRMTASNNGAYSEFDGFGKPDILAAIGFSGVIPDDPYNTLGTVGSISVSKESDNIFITIDSVANASKYEIYYDNIVVYTFPGNNFSPNPIKLPFKSLSKNPSHKIWYKALRYTSSTSESEKIDITDN